MIIKLLFYGGLEQVLSSTENAWAAGAYISTTCEQVSFFTGHVRNDTQNARQHQECIDVRPERFPWEHSPTFRSHWWNCNETGKFRHSLSLLALFSSWTQWLK